MTDRTANVIASRCRKDFLKNCDGIDLHLRFTITQQQNS